MMAFRLLPHLHEHLQDHIFRFLSSNDIACSVRLLNKAAAAHFNSPEHKTVRLSQPVPFGAFLHRYNASSPTWNTLTSEQRLQLLSLTAASGSLDNLKVLVPVVGLQSGSQAIAAAAAAGHLHICQYLLGQGYSVDGALQAAAGAGRRDFCEWLLANGAEWCQEAACAAALGGHIDILDWLLLRNPYSKEDMEDMFFDSFLLSRLLVAAVDGCHLATLQRLWRAWLLPPGQAEQPNPAQWRHLQEQQREKENSRLRHEDREALLSVAARSRTPDWRAKVEWLETLGYPRGSDACRAVTVLRDAVERLQWLGQRGYPLSGDVVTAAARAGNLPALQYLLEEAGAQVEARRSAYAAAFHGKLDTLKYLLGREAAVNTSKGTSGALAGPAADAEVSSTDGGDEAGDEAADEDGGAEDAEDAEGEGDEDEEGEEFGYSDDWYYLGSVAAVAGKPKDPAFAAAINGQTVVLKYLLEEAGAKLKPRSVPLWGVVEATSSIPLAALQLLHGRGLLATTAEEMEEADPEGVGEMHQVICEAVSKSDVASAAWLLGELQWPLGFDEDDRERVFFRVAKAGNVELLAWMVTHGVLQSVPEEALLAAVRGGCVAAVEWLLEHGCSWEVCSTDLHQEASFDSDLVTLRCLRRLGCPWRDGDTQCLEQH